MPSCSCHATHGTGSVPATAAPPATDGFSASLSVLMFSDGTPEPRSWPSGCQMLLAAAKRLAKICFSPPSAALGSYHASHGTVRPAPAKSIDGRLGLDVLVDVQRRALRHPLPVLERAHEDALGVAGLLLERRPRHARATGGERAADDVGDAGVLVGVDAGRRIVVDLRAVGRQADHRARRPCRDERGRRAGERGASEK